MQTSMLLLRMEPFPYVATTHFTSSILINAARLSSLIEKGACRGSLLHLGTSSPLATKSLFHAGIHWMRRQHGKVPWLGPDEASSFPG